jgi:putative N6-adenine-specific DNA methylase
MSTLVGRGGLKLEAAVQRFALGPAIRGARAVDVGASTGGFTEVLLAQAAASVTAIDVGHGQLHARLRQDPRVQALEKTDFKTLALRVAPGPFDFFTVDVSFVAARSMLRSLAFRLRAGAEGVVLVKPQFELPGHAVRAGQVSDPALRARALGTFAKKAQALGFTIVQHVDSPVAGGEGTVEILAHLRFEGRTEKLPPRPGAEAERARAPEARGSIRPPRPSEPAVSTEIRHWFAVAAPGLEEVVHAEVARLPGASAVRAVAGGVSFSGPLATGMAANLHLRVATRVLLRLGTVRAAEFSKLRRLLDKLSFERFVPPDLPLRLAVSQSRCRLYHTGAVAETAALAIADRVGKALPAAAKRPGEEEGETDEPETRVLLRGEGDQWTASVDSSGALLHRRGWRPETGRAPLRETLAAGLLALAGYDPALPFVDPMCGSGTIALEACALAMDRAPGLGRAFAFERWPGFDPGPWTALRAAAEGRVRAAPPAPVLAFDRDPRAVEIARRNAERAGLADRLTIETAELGARPAPGPAGLVLVNPPYGRRLGTPAAAGRLLRDLGRVLRDRFPGWRAGVLAAGRGVDKALGLRARSSHPLSNGGLRVTLVVADIPAKGGEMRAPPSSG